jgi:hypothetical protein
MGVGIGKIISGLLMLASGYGILTYPLPSALGFLPAGTIEPAQLLIVQALLSGKTISDAPALCQTALSMGQAYGGVPTEVLNACGIIDKYVPMGLYIVYGYMALGAILIIWGLIPLVASKTSTNTTQ